MEINLTSFNLYDNSLFNLDFSSILTDEIKIALLSSSYVLNITSHESYNDLTNELPTANGYTNGGQSLLNKTFIKIGNSWIFSSSSPLWNVVTGNLVAKYWVMYNNTKVSKPLYGYGFLNENNGNPLDVTTTPGKALNFIIPSSGWFNITRQV